jgi:predicted ArsR family transcriptional regulator
MTPRRDQQAASRHRGARREMVLATLRASSAPLTVVDIAAELDVHLNTVRFHLDALVEAGRVERLPAEGSGPGRPPIEYRLSRTMDRNGPSNYRLLAAMLSDHLASSASDPVKTATALGRSWGGAVLDSRPGGKSTKSEALTRVVDALADLGFQPEPLARPRATQIRLRHCPFLELVDAHADVICSLHLGLMQGALGALTGRVTVDRLERFVEPDLCVAHLASIGSRS